MAPDGHNGLPARSALSILRRGFDQFGQWRVLQDVAKTVCTVLRFGLFGPHCRQVISAYLGVVSEEVGDTGFEPVTSAV